MPYDNGNRTLEKISQVTSIMKSMQGLQTQEMEQGNVQMRGMLLQRELQGPSEREKFNFEQGKFAEQQRAEQVKYALTKFTELSKESSPATKAVMMGHMENMWVMMSPLEKETSKMIYDHSPLNPIEQKSVWWDSTMRAPQVTADPMKDIYAYGLQVKNLKDFQRQKVKFVTGEMPPEEKLFAISETMNVYTGSDGKTQVLSSGDLALDQKAKEHGTTPGALRASGGVVYGPEIEIAVSGHVFKTRTAYNAIEEKSMPSRTVPVKTGERNLDTEEEKLKDFAVAYANKDTEGKTDGSKTYNTVMARLEQGKSREWIIENVLKKLYPGFNFAFVDPGEFSALPIFGGYSPGKTETLTYWRGEEIELFTKDGKKVRYFYDHSSSRVMDDQGRLITNDLVGFETMIKSMTLEEVKKAAAGAEPVVQPKPVEPRVVQPKPVTAPTPVESAETEREKKFQAQTEKMSEKLNSILKWLEENTGKGSIPRVR
jgi:hypothetical protein